MPRPLKQSKKAPKAVKGMKLRGGYDAGAPKPTKNPKKALRGSKSVVTSGWKMRGTK